VNPYSKSSFNFDIKLKTRKMSKTVVASVLLVGASTVMNGSCFQGNAFLRPIQNNLAPNPIQNHLASNPPLHAAARPISMYVDSDWIGRASQELLFPGGSPNTDTAKLFEDLLDSEKQIRAAETLHGMPWKTSIQEGKPLLYMPFWEWQMAFMQKSLKNLRVKPMEERFKYNENLKKKARIVNLSFQSDEYRKIRMTYYDAGEGCQVFNSLWYPDPRYNLPVLGIDLLSFGGKKYLAIVDFQPIHDDEKDHELSYEDKLAPIKANYPSLKGKMSSKFYDETKFFSQEMLFARFEDPTIIQSELLEAFQKYVSMHVDLVRDCKGNDSTSAKYAVLERHGAYDTYSADRDPATGLFAAMFGKDWADDFVYDFLFSMSGRVSDCSKPIGHSNEVQENLTDTQRNMHITATIALPTN